MPKHLQQQTAEEDVGPGLVGIEALEKMIAHWLAGTSEEDFDKMRILAEKVLEGNTRTHKGTHTLKIRGVAE